MHYAGNVTVEETWKGLTEDERSVLIDVRTSAEWAFVGTCSLSLLGKEPLLVSWQEFPDMDVNPNFIETIKSRNIPKDHPLYFICRSGARSIAAAEALAKEGYEKCYNVVSGFEGYSNRAGHRGSLNGWKKAGLPWTQL